MDDVPLKYRRIFSGPVAKIGCFAAHTMSLVWLVLGAATCSLDPSRRLRRSLHGIISLPESYLKSLNRMTSASDAPTKLNVLLVGFANVFGKTKFKGSNMNVWKDD